MFPTLETFYIIGVKLWPTGQILALSVIMFGTSGQYKITVQAVGPAAIIQHVYCSYYKSQNALFSQDRTFIEGRKYDLIVLLLFNF